MNLNISKIVSHQTASVTWPLTNSLSMQSSLQCPDLWAAVQLSRTRHRWRLSTAHAHAETYTSVVAPTLPQVRRHRLRISATLTYVSSSAAVGRRGPVVIVKVHGVAGELTVEVGVVRRRGTESCVAWAPRAAVPPRRSCGMASALALVPALALVHVDVDSPGCHCYGRSP